MKRFLDVLFVVIICQLSISCSALKQEKLPIKEKQLEGLSSQWLNGKGPATFEASWYDNFANDQLNDLLDIALKNNSDLFQARQKILLAEEEVKLSQSALKPRAGLSLGASFDKAQSTSSNSSYNTSGQASWVADIWGRYASLSQAALEEFNITEAEWRGVYLNLQQKVASSYFEMCSIDSQISLQEKALSITKELENYYRKRFAEGFENESRLRSVSADRLQLESNLLELKKKRKLSENELAYLIGKAPGQLELKKAGIETLSQPKIGLIYEANLLNSRPDVIAAELRLRSLYYQKESRRAAKLPEVSLNINTSAGGGSSLSNIFSSWSAALIPQITFPILDPTIDIDLAKARIQLASGQETYRQKVRRALTDIENAFESLSKSESIYKLEESRLNEYQEAYSKSNQRVQAGLSPLPEALSAQINVLVQKERLLQTYQKILSDKLELYSAFGGSLQ